jgi:ABC-type sugar transport system substrate-binding protein
MMRYFAQFLQPFGHVTKRAGGSLLVGLLAVVVAACGGSSPGTGGTKAVRIGLVAFDTTTVAAQREADASKKAMEAAGWTVMMQDPSGDASKANALCTQFVAQKVDVVVVDVFQGGQMAQCLSSASSASIPVFFIAGVLAPGMAGAISTSIPTQINQIFVTYVKTLKNPKILSLQYSPGAPCLARQKDEFAQLTAAGVALSNVQSHEVKIPGQVVDSQAAAQAWLNAHPQSAGEDLVVWSCFSDAGLGANAAMKQAGRTVPIYTWDLTKQIVPLLKSGEIKATSISDAPKLGDQLVKMIKDYQGGNKTPQAVDATALVLDASSIDAYVAANPVS